MMAILLSCGFRMRSSRDVLDGRLAGHAACVGVSTERHACACACMDAAPTLQRYIEHGSRMFSRGEAESSRVNVQCRCMTLHLFELAVLKLQCAPRQTLIPHACGGSRALRRFKPRRWRLASKQNPTGSHFAAGVLGSMEDIHVKHHPASQRADRQANNEPESPGVLLPERLFLVVFHACLHP